MVAQQSIDEIYKEYLVGLAHLGSDATLASHQSNLAPLIEHCHRNDVDVARHIDEEFVAEFLVSSYPSCKITTVRGLIDTYANFLAYVWETHPKIIDLRIRDLLSNYQSQSNDDAEWLDNITTVDLQERTRKTVRTYLHHLRKRRYGTRIHAFVEIAVATGSRFEPLRQIDLGDVGLEEGEVTVGVSDRYLVGASDMLPSWTVGLTQRCQDALTSYINHHRFSAECLAEDPLFRTSQGRASRSTLKHEITETSERVVSQYGDDDHQHEPPSPLSGELIVSVSFSPIRKYGLQRHIEN